MTDTSKNLINQMLSAMGSDKNVDQLDAIRERATDTLSHYSCQTKSEIAALPETVQDMNLIGRYTAMVGAAGLITTIEVFDAIDAAVEAAYNIGKNEVTNVKPQQAKV